MVNKISSGHKSMVWENNSYPLSKSQNVQQKFNQNHKMKQIEKERNGRRVPYGGQGTLLKNITTPKLFKDNRLLN